MSHRADNRGTFAIIETWVGEGYLSVRTALITEDGLTDEADLTDRDNVEAMALTSRFRPFLITVVLFVAMVASWLGVFGDLGERTEALAPLLIISYAGLLGMYGASVTLNSPRPRNPTWFLISVFVRAALVGGAAILVARVIQTP